ncbi:MAG: NAD(+) diphosphatase [Burkholderiales bacterium]|nr:NAD(+) diphosphatase [Burkholderiales bacterium]
MSPPHFESGVQAPPGTIGDPAQPWRTPGHWFIFRGDQLLVETGPPSSDPTDDLRVLSRPSWARLPLQKSNTDHNRLGSAPARTLYLGRLDGIDCWGAEVAADAPAPAGTSWAGLRALFSVLPDAHFALAGRAIQLLDWDRSHQFCGRCGTRTEPKPEERARICPACRLPAYPRISPAVMALARRGRQLLLGRGPHFPAGMYSALAGFVEPGETLEQCLAREVEEEVGIRVSRIRYFASQPWPFPHSLMIAFACDWESGEIRPQAGEIEAADWFDVLQLPKLPSRISIARRLIDAEVQRITGEMRAGLA